MNNEPLISGMNNEHDQTLILKSSNPTVKCKLILLYCSTDLWYRHGPALVLIKIIPPYCKILMNTTVVLTFGIDMAQLWCQNHPTLL